MKKNLFFFSIIAIVLLLTTGCYIDYSCGNKDSEGNPIVNTVGNKIFKGEVVEKSEFGEYSAYVTVYVGGDKINKVVLSENSNEVTSSEYWPDRPASYQSDLNKYLKSFEGKTIKEIKTYKHEDSKNKLDMISGCTVTNDRILKAVQNALSKI